MTARRVVPTWGTRPSINQPLAGFLPASWESRVSQETHGERSLDEPPERGIEDDEELER